MNWQMQDKAEKILRLTEDKETAEFQFQEASVQMEELKESFARTQSKQMEMEKDAESSNRYQQEIESDAPPSVKTVISTTLLSCR